MSALTVLLIQDHNLGQYNNVIQNVKLTNNSLLLHSILPNIGDITGVTGISWQDSLKTMTSLFVDSVIHYSVITSVGSPINHTFLFIAKM